MPRKNSLYSRNSIWREVDALYDKLVEDCWFEELEGRIVPPHLLDWVLATHVISGYQHVFPTVYDAARCLKLDETNIRRAIARGKDARAGNYHFAYVSDTEAQAIHNRQYAEGASDYELQRSFLEETARGSIKVDKTGVSARKSRRVTITKPDGEILVFDTAGA